MIISVVMGGKILFIYLFWGGPGWRDPGYAAHRSLPCAGVAEAHLRSDRGALQATNYYMKLPQLSFFENIYHMLIG